MQKSYLKAWIISYKINSSGKTSTWKTKVNAIRWAFWDAKTRNKALTHYAPKPGKTFSKEFIRYSKLRVKSMQLNDHYSSWNAMRLITTTQHYLDTFK